MTKIQSQKHTTQSVSLEHTLDHITEKLVQTRPAAAYSSALLPIYSIYLTLIRLARVEGSILDQRWKVDISFFSLKMVLHLLAGLWSAACIAKYHQYRRSDSARMERVYTLKLELQQMCVQDPIDCHCLWGISRNFSVSCDDCSCTSLRVHTTHSSTRTVHPEAVYFGSAVRIGSYVWSFLLKASNRFSARVSDGLHTSGPRAGFLVG